MKYEHTPSLQRLYLYLSCKLSARFLENTSKSCVAYNGTAIIAGTMYLDNALFNDDGEQLPKQ